MHPHPLRSCFPKMTPTDISAFQYALMTYRNLPPSYKMPSAEFLYFSKRLERDAMDGKVDPFMYKYAVTPPKQ